MYGQSQLAFYQYKNYLISEGDLQQMLGPFVFWMKRNDFMRSIWETGGFQRLWKTTHSSHSLIR